jgi:two-component system chemotaxis response regulator CheB
VRALREAGAPSVVQDEATSVVWGMPGAVAQASLADQVLPLGDIASAITSAVRVARPSMRV